MSTGRLIATDYNHIVDLTDVRLVELEDTSLSLHFADFDDPIELSYDDDETARTMFESIRRVLAPPL